HLPAAFPSQIAEIGIFEIKRRQQRIEAAQLQKLSAIVSTGTSTAVETRVKIRNSRVDPVADPQRAILPPSLCQPGLLPNSIGIGEEYLAGDGEYLFISESGQQRRQETRPHPHVAIQEHNDIVRGRSKTGVRAATEPQVPVHRQNLHAGEV